MLCKIFRSPFESLNISRQNKKHLPQKMLFCTSGIGIRSRLRARSGSALTVPRTVIHFRPVRIPFEMKTKKEPPQGDSLFCTSGIGIRTPTYRVRVCCATVTQYRYVSRFVDEGYYSRCGRVCQGIFAKFFIFLL